MSGGVKHKGPRERLSGGEWIYGRNPVEEALAAGRREATEIVLPPYAEGEDGQLARIRDEARSRRIPIMTMDRDRLDKLVRFGHHQGVAMKVSPYPYVELDEILSGAEEDDNATILFLDHLEDPQNLGSILRTACATGVKGVVIPDDRACGVTPAAARASAGGSEYVKVCRTVNLVRAMKAAKEAGFWLTGLDWGEDAKPYTEIDFKGRTGIVVGAEGAGISRLARETCDFIAYLPMPGGFESLNAGVAAAVTLYETLRQKGTWK